MKHGVAVIALGMVAVGVVACASPVSQETSVAKEVPVSKETGAPPTAAKSAEQVQALRERAAEYWAARMEGDDKTQWELLEPRGKGRVTAKEYAAGRSGVRYLGYQIEDAVIDGYFAIVKVRLLFQPVLQRMASVPVQTVLMDDQWVRVAGTWYRQLDERQAPKLEP
jgi:hypothetical protein